MRLYQLNLPFCLYHETGHYGFIYQLFIVVVSCAQLLQMSVRFLHFMAPHNNCARGVSYLKLLSTWFNDVTHMNVCGRVPAANAPGCTAAEDLLYKPWSLVVPTCTARCLHQRP